MSFVLEVASERARLSVAQVTVPHPPGGGEAFALGTWLILLTSWGMGSYATEAYKLSAPDVRQRDFNQETLGSKKLAGNWQ